MENMTIGAYVYVRLTPKRDRHQATANNNIANPSGNSGDRITCGVITRAAAKKM